MNEQLPCLAKKFCAGISKIEICTLCLQSIMLRIKIIFWNFVSFPFIRTWNINFLDSWQQSFHACYQNCTLRFYLNSFWDVGVRSELYWKETFFETWRKVFDLFVKAAFYVSKGTLWVKIQLLKVLIFFQTLHIFERTFTVLEEKVFGRDVKIESYSLRLIRSIKKSIFESSLFLNSSELWTNNYRAWQKSFVQGYQKLKFVLSVFRVSCWG